MTYKIGDIFVCKKDVLGDGDTLDNLNSKTTNLIVSDRYKIIDIDVNSGLEQIAIYLEHINNDKFKCWFHLSNQSEIVYIYTYYLYKYFNTIKEIRRKKLTKICTK
jgi:hypothetical protein